MSVFLLQVVYSALLFSQPGSSLSANGSHHTTVKQAAEFPDIKIVGLDWISDSLEAKEVVDEAKYLMNQTNSSVIKDEDDAKEEADVKHEDDTKDEGSGNKKKRSRNEKVKMSSPESDEDKKPPVKKQKGTSKDVQKVKSSTVNIPVDEGCTLGGE